MWKLGLKPTTKADPSLYLDNFFVSEVVSNYPCMNQPTSIDGYEAVSYNELMAIHHAKPYPWMQESQ